MAMPPFDRARQRVVDLDFEDRADRGLGFDQQIVLEQAVYAELSALARTTASKTRSGRGFRALDPTGRPS